MGNSPRRPGPRRSPAPVASKSHPEKKPPLPSPGASRRKAPQSQLLIETEGPDPDTPPEDVRLVVGVVIGVHGVQGELKVRPLTDDVEQFESLRSIYFGDETEPRRIRSVRFHAGNVLLKIAGVTNPEDASLFRGMSLRVPARQLRPLEEDEFFLYQIVGLEARTESGQLVGTVVDVIETGASDVLVIEPAEGGQPELLPNLPDVVLDIDPAARRIIVRPLVYRD